LGDTYFLDFREANVLIKAVDSMSVLWRLLLPLCQAAVRAVVSQQLGMQGKVPSKYFLNM
jgi:hypothetical protein